jgi:hypothetical protein
MSLEWQQFSSSPADSQCAFESRLPMPFRRKTKFNNPSQPETIMPRILAVFCASLCLQFTMPEEQTPKEGEAGSSPCPPP